MQKFEIIQVDPFKYKKEIIGLWENNLLDTPEGRLEWLANNPERPAIWYLAFHEETKKVAGSISIMPRRVKISGETYLAGIVGDFIVEKEYRVFGPALQLMNTVINEYSRLDFAFLYTFSNHASEKVALRARFQKIGLVSRFAKPLKIKHRLVEYIHPILAKLIAPGFEFALKLISRETYTRGKGFFNEIVQLSPDYDSFWSQIKNQSLTLGERSSRYLEWRYFKNPFSKFRMFTYRPIENGSILGYIIFTIMNNNVYIFDILCTGDELYRIILGSFIKYLRRNDYNSVSIRISLNNPLRSCIKYFGFSDRHEDNPLLYAGDSKLLPPKWFSFDGDRNI